MRWLFDRQINVINMICAERQIKFGRKRKNRHYDADPNATSSNIGDRSEREVEFEKITGILPSIGIITLLFSQVYFIFRNIAQINKILQSTNYFANFNS
jgi:hypothetical protein